MSHAVFFTCCLPPQCALPVAKRSLVRNTHAHSWTRKSASLGASSASRQPRPHGASVLQQLQAQAPLEVPAAIASLSVLLQSVRHVESIVHKRISPPSSGKSPLPSPDAHAVQTRLLVAARCRHLHRLPPLSPPMHELLAPSSCQHQLFLLRRSRQHDSVTPPLPRPLQISPTAAMQQMTTTSFKLLKLPHLLLLLLYQEREVIAPFIYQ